MIRNVSLFTNAVFIGVLVWYVFIHVGVGVYYRKYVKPREVFFDDVYYRARISALTELNRQLNPEREYVVFLGDSLVEQFPLHELFPGLNVLNRGVGHDTTVGVLERLESTVNSVKMSKCFLLIGHNDLKYRSVEETAHNIERIVTALKAGEKYVISVLPTSDARYSAMIRQLNEKLETLAESRKFTFIDAYAPFVGQDGSVRTACFYDGVHLTLEGYLRLKTILAPFFAQRERVEEEREHGAVVAG